MKTKTITLGANRGKPRIWLEGAWLHDLGFVRGAHFTAAIDGGTLILRLAKADASGARTVSGKDKGDRPNPIIDLAGDWLQPMATADRKLTIAMSKGRLVITKADATTGATA